MLRLGILGLSVIAAMVILDCGGRTPLQDDDLFGTAGSIATTGASGTSVGSGAGGTVIGSAGGVVGTGGSLIDPGFGGTGFGTGGSAIVGTAGFGGAGVAGSTGIGGFVGTGGSVAGTGGFVGAGGSIGTAGAGGGPNQVRRLINELPGTRPNQDCVGCAGKCQGSAQCAANSACVAGLACAVNDCGMANGKAGMGCLFKCIGGDPQAFTLAIAALQCIYGTCGPSCAVGRMR